ncbi:MAG: hypothetical protein QHH25_05670 [Candidatus Acetothermia bacterium]|nr:hypothetical protein [Candidatus Acetothermia bacterium]
MKKIVAISAVLLLLSCGRVLAQEELQTPSERLAPPLAVPEAAEEEGPLSLSATGQVSWLVKYGIGDSRGLTERGYANQLLLEQALSVDAEGGVRIEWPLAGVLSLSAHLDNQKAENLQLLSIKYRGRNLEGGFGDFTVAGDTEFTGYDKSLKGLRVEWTPREDLRVRGVFARVSGIPQSKVFRGNTSPGTVTYMLRQPEQRWLEQPYLLNIRGLEYYRVSGFVPEFTELNLVFRPDQGLRDLLGSYGLGYLFPTIREDSRREVEASDYLVVEKEGEQFLLLRTEALELLRRALKDYIDDYNEAQDLTGEERKEYPLDEGSEYELGFLRGLIAGYVLLALDRTDLRLDGYQQERFYYLGYQEIDPDSVEVRVKLGEADFVEITDPSLIGYDYRLFAEEGVIELDFPASFFAALEENQAQVSFNYAVSGGLYVLGLSIAQGSERVYLNGKLLQRDLDYSIDYETGALLLFQELGPEDELRIDYEIFRGGLGGVTDYKRNLSGVLVSYSPTAFLTLSLDLLQAADSPVAGDTSSLRTMPNDHIVGGVSAKLDLGAFQGDLEFGYNYNRFPFDDNERKSLPNRINAIGAVSYQGREYTIFAGQNGLTVFDGARWRALGPAQGLAGRAVRALAATDELIVFATDSGVSVMKLEGEDPFAILTNWRRFYSSDGLASQDVRAALVQDGTLYLGTDKGLNRVRLAEMGKKERWEVYNLANQPEMVSEEVLELAGDGKFVYLGTPAGLMIFDPATESFAVPPELAGVRINGLAGSGREVLVATELGIRAYERGKGMGWLAAEPARAVAIFAGQVWRGTDEGLFRLGEREPLLRLAVTALGPSEAGLWVGSQADPDYELTLWLVDPSGAARSYPQQKTRIPGEDRYRFQDIPAWEHTDWGPALSLSLSQDLGKLKLEGALEWLSPRFTALVSEAREDLRGWSLEGTYAFTEELSLALKHEGDLEGAELSQTDPYARQSYTEKDSARVRWDFGPELELGYALERVDDRGEKDGFDEARHELDGTISGSLFDGRLGLSLSYADRSLANLKLPGRASGDQKIEAQATVRLLPGLDLLSHYARSSRSTRYLDGRRVWGTETLRFTVDWSRPLPLVQVDARYDWEAQRQLPVAEGGLEIEHDGQLDLQFDSLTLGELVLYPRGTVSFQQESGRSRFAGEGKLRGERGAFKGQASYKLSASLDERSARQELSNNLSLRLDYAGWKELTPSLSLQGTVRLLQHPSYGTKTSESWTATAGLGWKATVLDLTVSNSLSLSQVRVKEEREDMTSYSLRNSSTVGLPFLPQLALSLEASASYLGGTRSGKPRDSLEGELVLKGDYKLRGNWGASGLVGYVLNIDNLESTGSYQSLYFAVQLATTF